jgi:hypothetical protein
MANQLARLRSPDRAPSLAPRETLMPFLSKEARKSRGMARLERACARHGRAQALRAPEPFVIDGNQEKVARITDRPSRAPHGATARSLDPPRI